MDSKFLQLAVRYLLLERSKTAFISGISLFFVLFLVFSFFFFEFPANAFVDNKLRSFLSCEMFIIMMLKLSTAPVIVYCVVMAVSSLLYMYVKFYGLAKNIALLFGDEISLCISSVRIHCAQFIAEV